MKYLCIVHVDGQVFETFTPEFGKQFTDESMDYDQELIRRGHLIRAEALQSPESGVIVRVRDGKMSSTDGPFIETKEQLAGFILIEARDFNEAIQVAAGIPMARVGAIEVRPVRQLEHT